MKKEDKKFLILVGILMILGGFLSIFGPENQGPEPIKAIAWWIPLAVGAASGFMSGQRQKKQAKEHDKFRKEVIRYSPWTEMSDPGAMPYKGVLESTLGGAAGGAMLGYGVDKMAGGKFLDAASTAGATEGAAAGADAGAAGATQSAIKTPPVQAPTRMPASVPDPQASLRGSGASGSWGAPQVPMSPMPQQQGLQPWTTALGMQQQQQFPQIPYRPGYGPGYGG